MDVESQLSSAFVCAKCHHQGAQVEKLAHTGTGLSRMFDIQPYRYLYASCRNCGYTEIYNLNILQGRDDLGTVMDVLFGG